MAGKFAEDSRLEVNFVYFNGFAHSSLAEHFSKNWMHVYLYLGRGRLFGQCIELLFYRAFWHSIVFYILTFEQL